MRPALLAAVRQRTAQTLDTGDPEPVLEPDATAEAEALIELGPIDLELRHTVGWFYWVRHERSPDEDDYRSAMAALIPVYRADPGAVPAGARAVLDRGNDPAEWNDAGCERMAEFEDTGDLDTLRTAAAMFRQSADLVPEGHERYTMVLENLYTATAKLAVGTGELDPAREAVRVGRLLLASTPDGYGDIAADVARRLLTVYEYTGDPAALRDAAQTAWDGVERTREDDEGDADELAASLSDFSTCAQMLFSATGEETALAEAIGAARLAVETISAEHPGWAVCRSNLSQTLRIAYAHTGDTDLLDEAVEFARAGDNPAALAAVLQSAYEHRGDVELLHEAVAAGRAAGGSALVQANLGVSLRELYERTGDTGLLREAVAAHRAAVAATAPEHAKRASRMTNLGNTLRVLFQRTGDRAALAEALTALEEAGSAENLAIAYLAADRLEDAASAARAALAGAPPGHPLHARFQGNLGAILHQAGDVPGALTAARAAVAAVAPDHAERPGHLVHLGSVLISGFEQSGDPAALAEAREVLEESAALAVATVTDRIAALRRRARADLHAGHPDAALAAMETVVALLPQVAPAELYRADRAHRLGAEAGVGSAAAAAALAAGRPDRAADLLERARGVLLAESITARSGPVDHLGAGPLVFVTTTPARCDALILTGDGPPQPVPLPALHHTEAHERAAVFLHARRHGDEPEILAVLTWLWDAVAEPVLAALGLDAAPAAGEPWPRLWWCPAGVLAFLPLHAAGHHDRPGRSVLDRAVSSYTPTARALAFARRPAPPAPGPRPSLVVALPETPDAAPLPGVAYESRRVAKLLHPASVLHAAAATRESVLAALPAHPVVHFACHGISDWNAPETSRLLLHDHATAPLTVAALAELDLPAAELAYLSACRTGETHPNLTDEAVHITGAFQLAGFRSVIGTLWSVPDEPASRIAIDVYTHLTAGGTRPPATAQSALALHHAVRRRREEEPTSPSRWAAHVHTGA
ncbi:CHAT domain-containing protein [Dactylosporangium sp. NPDC051541]|uniref:CHAT domain-containing protein n=1 Tax=Dactylosporangium sp. NPDC051541 TaxID=3363977 RepID=UPI0037B105E7